jgi:transposase-like protein
MSQEDAKPVEYAMDLKLAAVRRVLAGESVNAVAQELGIRRKRLYVWKDRYAELGKAGLVRKRGGRPRGRGAAFCRSPFAYAGWVLL